MRLGIAPNLPRKWLAATRMKRIEGLFRRRQARRFNLIALIS
jgi:hypothetical protein